MNKENKNNKKIKKERKVSKIILVEGVILLTLILCLLIVSAIKRAQPQDNKQNRVENEQESNQISTQKNEKEKEQKNEKDNEKENEQKSDEEQLLKQKQEEEIAKQKEEQQKILEQAKFLATGYDYDSAIELIQSYHGYEANSEFQTLLSEIETKKAECVPFGAYSSSAQVNHIFFHSLIADTSKAFDNDYDSNGYNYYMTTISEFQEMMQQMYDQGYVLVSIHDVVQLVEQEDGTMAYEEGSILLPPDKKPFVLSQDDVNYYDYMDGDGFASCMVIDENGRPSTKMLLEDGSYVIGDYDLVPVLETFLETHPDFSYRGARGLIALTGYEGALGYRTDPASKDSPTYEQDKETVREVAKVMKEWGWEFACHSNGHRNMETCTNEFLVYDTDNWLENVGSLVGETDVYIFPYGIDIENTVSGYKSYKFEKLFEKGFRFYCGVFKEPWIQVRKSYIRMTRRPLDGQAMLQFPERLADLFDLSKVIDPARPKLK